MIFGPFLTSQPASSAVDLTGDNCLRLAISTNPDEGMIFSGTGQHDAVFQIGGADLNQTYSIRAFHSRITDLLADDGPVKTNSANLTKLQAVDLVNISSGIAAILDNLAKQDRQVDATAAILGAALAQAEEMSLNLERAFTALDDVRVSLGAVNISLIEAEDLQDQVASLRADTTDELSALANEREDFDDEINATQSLTTDLKVAASSLQETNVGLNSTITGQLSSAISQEVDRASSVETSLATEASRLSTEASLEISRQEDRRTQNTNVTSLDVILDCNASK